MRCAQCGHVFTDPRPADHELARIYGDPGYYTTTTTRSALRRALDRFFLLRNQSRLRAAVASAHSRSGSPLRLVDLGCGDGFKLDVLASLAPPGSESIGVDLNPHSRAVVEARGHRFVQGAFDTNALAPASFDVVLSSHTIEHLPDPAALLRTMRRLVRPGGVVIVNTPSIDGVDFTLLARTGWGLYCMPEHLQFFSRRSLTRLAEQVGLTLEGTAYFPSPAQWIWSARVFAHQRGWPELAARFPTNAQLTFSPSQIALFGASLALDATLRLATGSSSDMQLTFAAQPETP